MATRSLDDCLRNGGDPALARLSAHAARLLRLQRLLDANLPRPLQRSVRIANVRLGKLFLHAENNAVAVKLRQITPTLLKVFCSDAAQITGIEVRVQPGPVKARAPRQPLLLPGERVKRGLSALADGLPPDSPLRESLQRLVQTGDSDG